MNRQMSLLLSADVELDSSVIEQNDSRFLSTLQKWKQAEIFGFDIETYGENSGDGLNPWKGEIRIITIALPSKEVLLFDFGGWDCERDKIMVFFQKFGLLEILKERLENPRVIKVGHNLKFDALWVLVKFGIHLRTVRDTMLESQVFWAGISNYRHSLKDVAKRVLGVEIDKSQQKSDFGWELTNIQKNYAALDALTTLEVHQKLWLMLTEVTLRGQAIAECGSVPGFVQMEFYGMPVDSKILESVLARYKAVAAEVLTPFTEAFPGLNPSSPQQLKKALQERYQITLSSTDAEELSRHNDKPPLKALSLWRTLVKSVEYLESVQKKLRDGSVRSEYRVMAPKGFGRSTSSNPNLQNPPNPGNLPKELKVYSLPAVRDIFRVPPGKKLIISDLSQAHARIATQASRDPVLIAAYRQNQDVHCLTASKLAQIQGLGDEWTPEAIAKWRKDKQHPNQAKATRLRNVSKNVFYGSLNVQGWQTLQTTARTGAGIEITDDEAKQAIEAWKQTYQQLYRYQREIFAAANKTEVIIPGCSGKFAEVRGLSGRRIFLEKQSRFSRSTEQTVEECKITDACAFVWTSTEADIIKLAIAGIVAEFDNHPEWGGSICNCAHDEVDCLVNEGYAEPAAKRIDILMQGAMGVFITHLPLSDATSDFRNSIVDCWAQKD